MRTIFITSFHTLISRNILQTSLLARMGERGMRGVLIVPAYKRDYFVGQFGDAVFAVEGVDTALTRRDLLFRRMALALTRTQSLSIKKRARYHADRKLLPYLGMALPALLFGRSRSAVRLLRAIDRRTAPRARFGALFERYAPSLLFSTDPQNECDVALMQEAEKRGTPTVGMVRSWDNLTAKGILRVVPDLLLVQNRVMAEEAERVSFIPSPQIGTVGIPHYDRYLVLRSGADRDSNLPHCSRAAFFARYGFDPQTPFILVAPMGDRYLRANKTDKRVLEELSLLHANILVRLPPGDVVNYEGFKSRGARVHFEKTGVSQWAGGPKLNEISEEDDINLATSLYYANLVVTGSTTVVVDACLFDTPMIVAGFDHEQRSYWDSIRLYYGYDHFAPPIRSGGIRIAASPEELVSLSRAYLAHPEIDAGGRACMREEEIHEPDGKATERLLDHLASFV